MDLKSVLGSKESRASGKSPSSSVTKAEFSKQLKKAIADRGWNQSELSRQASKHLPKPMTRDTISKYIRGATLPRPEHSRAIALALKIGPGDLLTSFLVDSQAAPSHVLEMSEVPGEPGVVWLRLNKPVPFKQALEIMRILEGVAK